MQGTSLQSFNNIGPMVSEEMSFDGNGGRTYDRPWTERDSYSSLWHFGQIDEETIQSVGDEVLATYIPKLGDRAVLKNYLSKPAKKKTKHTHLFEKLRNKLAEKDEKNNTKEELPAREKLLRKEKQVHWKPTRKIEFGWINDQVQVRKRFGGGTRKEDVSRSAVKEDLIEVGKRLFFPNGMSKKGSVDEFNFEILDFKETKLPVNITVSECYDLLKTGVVTFYLHTTKKESTDSSVPVPSSTVTSCQQTMLPADKTLFCIL